MISARCVNVAGVPELPVPPTIPGRPSSSRETRLMAVAPGATVATTCAFHCSESVAPGGRSSIQVSIVFPPPTLMPGFAGAQPDGVMVQPRQGSLSPSPGAHGLSSGGAVSQMETFHQVLVLDRFLRKIVYIISS